MSEIDGWREYKFYLIEQYKLTHDKWYIKEKRKVDKIIKKLLEKEDKKLLKELKEVK